MHGLILGEINVDFALGPLPILRKQLSKK